MRVELDGVPMIGSPLNLSATPVRYQRRPPKLGEHTRELLNGIGYSQEKIDMLLAQAAVA